MLHKCGLPNKYNSSNSSSNNNVAKAIMTKKVLCERIFGYSKIESNILRRARIRKKVVENIVDMIKGCRGCGKRVTEEVVRCVQQINFHT